ncbi:MAG: hypothetical protein JW956_13075 [Calditrichaceae bacterium]|nr:hypothetical protein [Calditrichaceae bacterium]
MKTISGKLVYWFPRILCILAILFISLFALDSFSPNQTTWQQISGFIIHLIPSFILTAFLLIAWKWEFVGGIIFILIGLVFTPIIFIHNYNMNHSIGLSLIIILSITFPFVVVGTFFLINYHIHKRNHLSV